MEAKYELKENARLGGAPSDEKEGRILNRVIRWELGGITYEADPHQQEKLVQVRAQYQRGVQSVPSLLGACRHAHTPGFYPLQHRAYLLSFIATMRSEILALGHLVKPHRRVLAVC